MTNNDNISLPPPPPPIFQQQKSIFDGLLNNSEMLLAIWLTSDINDRIKTKLQYIADKLKIFMSTDECIKYMNEDVSGKPIKIFLIISVNENNELDLLIENVHDLNQLHLIYINQNESMVKKKNFSIEKYSK
ncbi:unnamed protein product, partial [Didymodactylos carnosus]